MNKIGDICPEPLVTMNIINKYLKSVQPQLIRQFEESMAAYKVYQALKEEKECPT